MDDTSRRWFLSFLMRFRLNDMGNRKKLESEDRTRKQILNEFLRNMNTKKNKLIPIFFLPYLFLFPTYFKKKEQSGVERSAHAQLAHWISEKKTHTHRTLEILFLLKRKQLTTALDLHINSKIRIYFLFLDFH